MCVGRTSFGDRQQHGPRGLHLFNSFTDGAPGFRQHTFPPADSELPLPLLVDDNDDELHCDTSTTFALGRQHPPSPPPLVMFGRCNGVSVVVGLDVVLVVLVDVVVVGRKGGSVTGFGFGVGFDFRLFLGPVCFTVGGT